MDNGNTVTLANGTVIRFGAGAHSPAEFQAKHLGPRFVNGTITPFPGADYYTVCYGELYAYVDTAHLGLIPAQYVAIWSVGVPDCESDVVAGESYAGQWIIVDSEY